MTRPLNCALLLATLFLLPPAPAGAAQSYDNCAGFITSLPATITTQGVWCLDRDLSTNLASGNAITIDTNNVTIDCNEFKIGNLSAGPGTNATGVRASVRLNATIRNCNIRGFYRGIYLTGGGGHVVERNNLNGNWVYGLRVTSPGSTVRDNLVFDTGGSSVVTTFATGISVAGGVYVLNNTVHGVAGTGAGNFTANGITSDNNGLGQIHGNRVNHLVAAGSGAPRGIYSTNSGWEVVRDNSVIGPSPFVVGGLGIRCLSVQATAHNNVVAGFADDISGCRSTANSVPVY